MLSSSYRFLSLFKSSFQYRVTVRAMFRRVLKSTAHILNFSYSLFPDQEDTSDDPVVEVDRRNETASIDLVGKSAAVQTWLAKQSSAQKPLSAFESSLKLEEVHVLSKRRNPKFEQVDPEIGKRENRVHQFKFVE